jgi:hypothetical protein
MLTFVLSNVYSQTTVSNTDKDELVQKCLTFQPLMDKIPAQVQGMMSNYFIYGKSNELNVTQNLIVNGKSISFLDKSDLSITKPFYDFFTLNIETNTAFVRYYFSYNQNGEKTTIPVTINFIKTNSVWQVLQHTI